MITQKQHPRQYALHKSEYDAVYKDIMVNGLDANGPYTRKCQDYIKKITGRKHIFMTNSGTAAITAAIYALDLFDKKVAVGSYNYVACVNQIKAFCRPVFIDCDENTLIDINEIPMDCDAVMLVNYWGNIVNYNQIAKKFKGKIITDCSQSFGATYVGKNDGYFGDVSIFAFGGQKPIGTRGFTGAIATDDDGVAHRIDCAINQGKVGERRDVPTEMLGFRGTPQELQCGILSVGMKHWKKWLKKRQKIARHIMKSLVQCPIRFLESNDHCEPSFYRIAFEVEKMQDFVSHMQKQGIDAQSTFMDDFNQLWGTTKKKMPMTQKMISHVASLPLSPFFTDGEVEKIIVSVKKYFNQG
jgi:dTDP-4-amino-4,6-dideoxygalactose transaminase